MANDTIVIKRYSWSKYGGGRSALMEYKTKTWYCQSCSEKQTATIPKYLMDMQFDDFANVCAVCKHKAISSHLAIFKELLAIVRKPQYMFKVENLQTLTAIM